MEAVVEALYGSLPGIEICFIRSFLYTTHAEWVRGYPHIVTIQA